MADIMLSVLVATYNHEDYIEQAIRSILMQNVSFKYEVLIGEDCSTDHTREILKRLEPALPSYFHIFYRETNMGGRGRNNASDIRNRARGKYIIMLEGDDYWTYDSKLQKQVDFLEQNPEYVAVAHNVTVVDREGRDRKDFTYPECKHEDYTFKDFEYGYLAGQTATLMQRNPVCTPGYKNVFIDIDFPGDRRINFLLLCNGKVRCMQEKWSAYRYVPETGTSHMARVSHIAADSKEYMDMFHNMLLYHRELLSFTRSEFADNLEAIQCIEAQYMWLLLKDILRRTESDSTWRNWFKEFSKLKSRTHTIGYINREIDRYLAKKTHRLFQS